MFNLLLVLALLFASLRNGVASVNNVEETVMNDQKFEIHRGKRSLQGDFTIDLLFLSQTTSAQKAGFLAARDKWMTLVTGLTASTFCIPAGKKICGHVFAQQTCVNDILILVVLGPIDGSGGILGESGPCALALGKPRVGVMIFDSADANSLISGNQWNPTILHEMAHVLGFGTLWDTHRLITPKGRGAPFKYLGKNGIAGLAKDWGKKAGKPIIENLGGPGTARGHWKEAVYHNELMTGWISAPGVPMPLSTMTVRSLQDFGYKVDASKADSFKKSAGRRLRDAETKIYLGNDLHLSELIDYDEFATPKYGREADFHTEKSTWDEKKKRLPSTQ